MNTRNFSRRDFLKTTAAVSAAAATLTSLGTNFAFAQGQQRIKVGLVGCGGRGTGAASDAIHASPLVDIVAMGDLFKDQLETSRRNQSSLDEKESGRAKGTPHPQYKVTDDKCFVGFDAYKK